MDNDADLPEPKENRRWGILRHPLVIAGLSSLTAIVVAVISLSSGSDSPVAPTPATSAGPAQQRDGDVSHRVESDLQAYEAGWTVAFEGPLPDTAQYPMVDGDFDYVGKLRWAKTRGAVDVGESHLRLYLQNDGAERVTIRGVSAKVIERVTPIAQTYLESPSAGLNELIQLDFDLDAGDEVEAGEAGVEPGADAEPFFSTHNVTLDPGETTDFRITTRAAGCLCRYRFAVEIVTVDSTLTLEVGDSSGRPFAISGRAKSYDDRWLDAQLSCNAPGIVRVAADRTPDCAAHPPT